MINVRLEEGEALTGLLEGGKYQDEPYEIHVAGWPLPIIFIRGSKRSYYYPVPSSRLNLSHDHGYKLASMQIRVLRVPSGYHDEAVSAE